MTDKSISDHIERDKKILDDPLVSSQSRRHAEEELEQLERYQQNHPNDDHDPSPLELYCNDNPEALECRVYEV
jgi:hypothetical protein